MTVAEPPIDPAGKRRGRDRLPPIVRAGGRRARLVVARWRALPSLLVIGAHKSGTSSMHALLAQHPAVVGPAFKEVNFFSQHWDLGLDHYRSCFPLRATLALTSRRAGTRAITFDSSPSYLPHPLAPARVRACLPEARFVVLLRNPTDRAWSGYLHACRRGRETLPFREALAAERERQSADQRGAAAAGTLERAYVARGRYLDHLERWWAELPRDRFLILASDELFADPAGTAERVHAFVGLPPVAPTDLRPRNQGLGEPLDPEVRTALDAEFADANDRLFAATGIDFRGPSAPA